MFGKTKILLREKINYNYLQIKKKLKKKKTLKSYQKFFGNVSSDTEYVNSMYMERESQISH